MSSESDDSLDSRYRLDGREHNDPSMGDSFGRFDVHQGHSSSPSGEDLLRLAAVHPLVDDEDHASPIRPHLGFDPSRSPSPPSGPASSLSASPLSSFTETAVVRPPQIPALHRLNHLKNHMKQLKRLYRQEVHQEELAQRDTLLQTLCTSSITMFRHCASRERFFTAVRALLCQYLPALNSKLFEVEQFNGRSYLITQAKEGAAHDTLSTNPTAVDLTAEGIAAQWDRLGVAGRAAALLGYSAMDDAESLASADDSLQQAGVQAAQPSSSMPQPDLSCIKNWRRDVADYVVPCPNHHLVLQIPAAKLLQIGFRPEIDLCISLSGSSNTRVSVEDGGVRFETRRHHRSRQEQPQGDLQLLMVALRAVEGSAIGVFEAVVDSSTRVSVEFLDAFGVLLASAIEMRRNVCRSTMGNVDVRIRRRSHVCSLEPCVPLLRVPLSSNANNPLGDWELVAFNSGALLEDVDSAMLHAIRKPVESLLTESETRACEIAFYDSVPRIIARLWDRLNRTLSSRDREDWQHSLRSVLAEVSTSGDDFGGGYCLGSNQIPRIAHIRVLFPRESSDCYRNFYTNDCAEDLEATASLDREIDMLQQAMKSRQIIESSGTNVQLTATAIDIASSATLADSSRNHPSDSAIGILVGVQSIEGCGGNLLQRVKEHLLSVLGIAVQAYADLAANRALVLQLEGDLCAVKLGSEHFQHALATSKAMTEIVEQCVSIANTEELVETVNAVDASEISGVLAAVKLFVVEKTAEGTNSSDSAGCEDDHYRIWTMTNGAQVTIGTIMTTSKTADDLLRTVAVRHRVESQSSIESEDPFRESSSRRYHTLPLLSPVGSGDELPLGVIEIELSDSSNRNDVLSAVAPLARMLCGVLNMHANVQSTRTAWDEQVNSLSREHVQRWNNLMECVARWSRLPLCDSMPFDSWCEQISSLCRQLVPSADFVNVFLHFAGDATAGNTNASASARTKAVVRTLRTKPCGQAVDEDAYREISLFNQSVIGMIAHYPLIRSASQQEEPLGVLVLSKKSAISFSEQDHQLMQLAAQLVSAQAVTLRAREEARLQVKILNDALEQRSGATRQLYEAHTSVSNRAQQLLMLLEVSRLDQECQDGDAHDQAVSTSDPHAIHRHLRLALRQVQTRLDSFGSLESVGALVIDRTDQNKLSCSVIGDVKEARGDEEPVAHVLLDRADGEANCWYSPRRWMLHKDPFSSLPPRILQLLGIKAQINEPSDTSTMISMVPVDIDGDQERSADGHCVVLLAVASSDPVDHQSQGSLMGDSFIGELTAAIANFLRSRLRISQLNESVANLTAGVNTLESQQLELQQDYRLLELANIVWMEVLGSVSSEFTGGASNNAGGDTGVMSQQMEPPLLSCLRKSFHERIVPFLREELLICAIELVLDLATPGQAQPSIRNNIDCFMDSLDTSRAHALGDSTDSVIIGSEATSPANSTSRFWLIQRFLQPHDKVSRYFGLFYIEWELLPSSNTNATADKARNTLLWLSDWLQTLAQYCYDWCSAIARITSGEDQIHELVAHERAQTASLNVYEYWKDRWAALLGFARALQAARPIADASMIGGKESGYAWAWDHVFAQLSALNATGEDVVVWARDAHEEGDIARIVRRDGARQHKSWDDVSTWQASESDRFQLIVAASTTRESLGVIEFKRLDALSCSNEHAKNYQELLALIIGSYLTVQRLEQETEHERRLGQTAEEELHVEADQLGKKVALAWTAYQQIEEWIQQLQPPRGVKPVKNACSLIQALFRRIEQRLVYTSDSCESEIARARLLLRIRDGKEVDVTTSCDLECACQLSSSFEAIARKMSRASTSIAGEDGAEHATVTTFPSSVSDHQIFPACASNYRIAKRSEDTHCVVLQVGCDAGEGGTSCTLMLCVQRLERDRDSVMMKMLKVLCLRLGDAIAKLLRGSLEREHFSSVEQQLAAVNRELATEQRRSTRIAEAMATATQCISRALSSPADTEDATITSAIQEVVKMLTGGAIVVEFAGEFGQKEAAGAASSSPKATRRRHSQSAHVGDKPGCTVKNDRRLQSADCGQDGPVTCRYSTEGSIDELELEVHGAHLVLSAPEPHLKPDLSQLWQDKPALALVVKLADSLATIDRARSESRAHRHEGDRVVATLRTECATLEAACRETKSTLQRSETQRAFVRSIVKKALEPVPVHAIKFMAKLTSETCASCDTVVQALGDALSDVHGVESVAIRDLTASTQHGDRTQLPLYASPSLLLGGKQPLVDSEQIDWIVDRCVARQETEILTLKAGKSEASSTDVSHAADKRWLVIMPCVVGTAALAVLLLVASSGQPERSASRKELYQVNHARLLCRLAAWRCEQLASEAALTERVDFLTKGQAEAEVALQSSSLQLRRVQEERHSYRQMLLGVTEDVFQALLWSDKTWQKVFSSTRKLVSVWQHLTGVLQDRVASSIASAVNVRVRLYGVIRSRGLVFHLPTAATAFAYSTTIDLAAHPSTRRLWDVLMHPASSGSDPVMEEGNGSNRTILIPVSIRDDGGLDGLPIAVAAITIVQPRELETSAFSDECMVAVRDLVGMLAPFIWGISCAVRSRRGVVQGKDQHHDHRLEKQRLHGDSTIAANLGSISTSFDPPHRGGLPISPTTVTKHAPNWSSGMDDRGHDPSNQLGSMGVLEPAAVSRRDMCCADENGEDDFDDDDEDSASVATSFTSSQGAPKKTRVTSERLVPFLLKLQRAGSVKALQRLVADELKGVWVGRSSRPAPAVSFELVDIRNEDSNQLSEGNVFDSVHSALLPEAVLNEVLQRLNTKEPFQSAAMPRVWKFASGSSTRGTVSDEFWVAVLIEPSNNTSQAHATIGLLVVRGTRLQSAFGGYDEEVSLAHVLQGLRQQLSQIQRHAELQEQVSDSLRREADHIEQTACLVEMETRHRHTDAFSKLALRLSVAENERELVRVTSQFLRDYLQCGRVNYEPNKQNLSSGISKGAQANQESDDEESAVLELGQSLCCEGDDEQNSKNGNDCGEQAAPFGASSTAVEMQHSVKLRVFSAQWDNASSRLLGTFSAHLEPGASPQLTDVEHQKTLKNVAALVDAAFHRLRALGAVQRYGKSGKLVARELEQLQTENAKLLDVREQQRLSNDTLQQQFEGLARVKRDLEAEVTALRSQLQDCEARRAQSEEDAVLAQQQLAQVAAAADKAQRAHGDVVRLQEVTETQQERVRVLEKRNMKRRLQVQQLADEVGRLKKTEEIDKLRVAELEKQLAIAQQQQQQQSRSGGRSAGGVGDVGPAAMADASFAGRRRVSTTERHVDQQQERERRMQKLKQMRLAEELRCLAALEVRELNTRQSDKVRMRRGAVDQVTVRRNSEEQLKQRGQPQRSPGLVVPLPFKGT